MSDYINLFVLSNCILHFPIKIVIGFLPATNKQLWILTTKDCYYLEYAKCKNLGYRKMFNGTENKISFLPMLHWN